MEPKQEVELLILAKDFKETYYTNQDDCAITRACRRAKLSARHTGEDCVIGSSGAYQLPKGVLEMVKAIYEGLGRIHPAYTVWNEMVRKTIHSRLIIPPIDIRCTAVRCKAMEYVMDADLLRERQAHRIFANEVMTETGRMRSNEPGPQSPPNVIGRRIVVEGGSRGWLRRQFLEGGHNTPTQAMNASRVNPIAPPTQEEIEEMKKQLAESIRQIHLYWASTPAAPSSLVEYALAD